MEFIIRILFPFKSGYLYRRSCGKIKSALNRAQKSLGNESGKIESDDFAAKIAHCQPDFVGRNLWRNIKKDAYDVLVISTDLPIHFFYLIWNQSDFTDFTHLQIYHHFWSAYRA